MAKQTWLEKLIAEEVQKVLLEQAEAPKDAPFGQYLWAGPTTFGGRKEKIRKDENEEPNTPIEDDFFKSFVKHVDLGSSDSLETLISTYLKRIKDQGLYSEYINPPDVPLYRGIIVPHEIASKILGIPVEEIKSDSSRVRRASNPGTLPVTKKIMSWSVDLDVALTFAQSVKVDKVAIVFVAHPQHGGDFYLNPFNLLKKFDLEKATPYLNQEKEVISFGAVPYKEAYYYNMYNKALGGPLSDPEIKALAKHFTAQLEEKIFEALQVGVTPNSLNLVMLQTIQKFLVNIQTEFPYYKVLTNQQLERGKENLVLSFTKHGNGDIYDLIEFEYDPDRLSAKLNYLIGNESWERAFQSFLIGMTFTASNFNGLKALKYDRLMDAFKQAIAGTD